MSDVQLVAALVVLGVDERRCELTHVDATSHSNCRVQPQFPSKRVDVSSKVVWLCFRANNCIDRRSYRRSPSNHGEGKTSSPAGMCSPSTAYLQCTSSSPFFPAADPVTWTCGQTGSWVQRTARDCNLPDVDTRSFHGMDGKDLCSLVREDFGRLTSPYSGDVLMSQLSFLKSQCRFTGRCHTR